LSIRLLLWQTVPLCSHPGSVDLHHLSYVFFAAVEVACMALIVWSVRTRRDPVRALGREPARAVTSGNVSV